MRYTCDHPFYMGHMIQIRNVPSDIHREMKSRAAKAGMSLSEYLLREIRQIAETPTLEEMMARLAKRPPAITELTSEEAVRAERDGR